MGKLAHIHPTKKAPWRDIREEFVNVQQLASATPRLWYQDGPKRKRRLVRGNMLFQYRQFRRQAGGIRASQLRAYLERCIFSSKILKVELIWPDNQEVNGKVLVRRMRSAIAGRSATPRARTGS